MKPAFTAEAFRRQVRQRLFSEERAAGEHRVQGGPPAALMQPTGWSDGKLQVRHLTVQLYGALS
jgi:hypothetical protein